MRQIVNLRTIGSRLIVACLVAIVITMLTLAAVLPGWVRTHELAVLDDRLGAEAQLAADDVVNELNKGPDPHVDALAKRLGESTKSRITIVAPDGKIIGDSLQDLGQVGNQATTAKEMQQALANGRGVDLRYSQTVGSEVLYVAVSIVRDGATIGAASVGVSINDVDRLIADLTRVILFATLGGSLLAVLVGIVVARTIALPLSHLTRVAAAISNDPNRATGVWLSGGPAEIVHLGETLERMAIAIRESLRRVGVERDRLDAVLANMADGIVIVNADGRVTRLNRAAEHLLKIAKDTQSGRTVAEVLRDYELVELLEQVQGSDSPFATRFLEWRNPRRFLRAAASRFGIGEATQTLLVLQDLTELHRLETIRRDFVANVSHELRTPIAAIKAMAETLQDGAVDDSSAARDFISRIEQEADGMHRLVEELLELSRLESGRADIVLMPIDPEGLLNSAVRRLGTMADRANVSLTVDASPDLPSILADFERMSQVLVNLIHNAIKFTPPGGAIVVRAVRDADRVRLSVSDTGVGLAPELLPRVFERFYKADRARAGNGTGLGLAIAKHTVQLHAGEIWAESGGPGRGTTIHVTLPLAATP